MIEGSASVSVPPAIDCDAAGIFEGRADSIARSRAAANYIPLCRAVVCICAIAKFFICSHRFAGSGYYFYEKKKKKEGYCMFQ